MCARPLALCRSHRFSRRRSRGRAHSALLFSFLLLDGWFDFAYRFPYAQTEGAAMAVVRQVVVRPAICASRFLEEPRRTEEADTRPVASSCQMVAALRRIVRANQIFATSSAGQRFAARASTLMASTSAAAALDEYTRKAFRLGNRPVRLLLHENLSYSICDARAPRTFLLLLLLWFTRKRSLARTTFTQAQ